MEGELFYFEKLDVYQKALNFISEVFDLFDKLHYSIQKNIGDNLLRAVMSIANNIAEGSGRRGKKEKKHFFEISQGSAYECVPMLTILHRKEQIEEIIYKKLYDACYDISRMLSGLIKSVV